MTLLLRTAMIFFGTLLAAALLALGEPAGPAASGAAAHRVGMALSSAQAAPSGELAAATRLSPH